MCIFIQKQGQKIFETQQKIFLKLLKEALGSFTFSHFPVWTSSFFSLTVK